MKYFPRIFAVSILLVIVSCVTTRAQSELSKSLNDISGQLKTVKTSSSEWKQSLHSNPQRPYQVFLELSGSDKKGQPLNYLYEINLADLDPSAIKYEIKKDEMSVKLRALKNKGFIKVKEGNQKIDYTDELLVYANQIENARALVESFQKAVPLAKTAMEQAIKVGSTFGALTDWLKANVPTQTAGSAGFKQSLMYQEGYKNLKVKVSQQRDEKGKVEEESYDFNLADMDGSNINMAVSGEWVYLELPTQAKQKYISYTKSGKVQNPDNSVKLYFFDVEKAREGKMYLEKLLPTTGPVSDGLKPTYKSMADGLEKIKAAIKNVEETNQSITADCQTVLSVNSNGKTSEYRFFWGDIDESSPKIKVSGKVFELSFGTQAKQKFIEVWKNGEKESYTNSVELIADDIETFRYLPGLLNQLIPDCRKSAKQLQVKSGTEISYVNDRLKNAKNVSKIGAQVLEGSDKCKLKFTKTIVGGKNAGPISYEMVLSEFDGSSVAMEVSGSSVYVVATTRTKEKTIKSFKDQVPSDYVNEIKIECEDLISGQEVKECLSRIIAGCPK